MKLILSGASAALFVLAALPANASTVVAEGVFTPAHPGFLESVINFYPSAIPVTRDYEFTVEFDRPVAFEVMAFNNMVYNDYDYLGHYLGGNDHPISYFFATNGPANSLTFVQHMVVGAVPMGGYTRYYDTHFNAAVSAIADDASPLSYLVTMTPVPEPGAWALMVLGFGMAGAGLRSRRRASSPVQL